MRCFPSQNSFPFLHKWALLPLECCSRGELHLKRDLSKEQSQSPFCRALSCPPHTQHHHECTDRAPSSLPMVLLSSMRALHGGFAPVLCLTLTLACGFCRKALHKCFIWGLCMRAFHQHFVQGLWQWLAPLPCTFTLGMVRSFLILYVGLIPDVVFTVSTLSQNSDQGSGFFFFVICFNFTHSACSRGRRADSKSVLLLMVCFQGNWKSKGPQTDTVLFL